MNNICKEQLKFLYTKNSLIELRLRPIQEKDTPLIIKWRNADFVRNNFIFRETFTMEMHTKWLYDRVFTGNVIQYIIEIAKLNMPIGSVYLRDIDLQNESGEFGIFIGEKEYIGKGYGTNATKTFIHFCFSLGFHRIFLRLLDNNLIAEKCYANVGFCKEGIARDMVLIDGKRQNIVFMSAISSGGAKYKIISVKNCRNMAIITKVVAA